MPSSPYGAAKVAGEGYVRTYHRLYGLVGICLALGNVYGPRQDYRGAYIAVIMKMLDSIDRGEALKVYGKGEAEVRTLDGVSVDLARGEFTAIMGPSGSGKSTMMHCAAGLDAVTSGEVYILRYVP